MGILTSTINTHKHSNQDYQNNYEDYKHQVIQTNLNLSSGYSDDTLQK